MNETQMHNVFVHVQKAVNELLDVDRFYAVLLEAEKEELSFPYVWKDGLELPKEKAPWTNRHLNEAWLLDRTLKQDRDPSEDSAVAYWPTSEKRPGSWLGTPVSIDENTILGLVVENWRSHQAFDANSRRILETIAKQAALSIRNAQLVQEWQSEEKRRRAAERFMALNKIAGEFAHSMNNVVGTIPVSIALARQNLDPKDRRQADVLEQLELIDLASRRLLQKAQALRDTTQQRAREPVDVNALVDNAIKRAITSQPSARERIKVEKELAKDLPKITVERDGFTDTLTSILRNGLEAMPQRGTLSVCTQLAQKGGIPVIDIIVKDSGIGISEENLKHIFDPFFSTKEAGMGFGLWRDKIVIEELGGRIDVDSQPSKGTTFRIQLPIK